MFILAAALIVAGVALFVAAPLGIGLVGARAKSAGELQIERHEHDRALAMQGLRELEFDREMGKLSEADYAALREGLMARALGASAALERLHAALAPAPETAAALPRLVKSQAAPATAPAAASRIRFCPQCG